jgi:hypothetical protein
MKLENYSVRELTSEEQLDVNGGGFLANVWDAICTAAEWIWDNLKISASYNYTSGASITISNR